MIRTTKTRAINLLQDISDTIDRYGIGALARIGLIELVWIASALIPVLFVLATLIDFSKNWMAVIPGFWGLTTFLLVLTVGVFVAYQPSLYVARWRERSIKKSPRRPSPWRDEGTARAVKPEPR